VLALYFATILSFPGRSYLFKGSVFPYLITGVAIGFVFLYSSARRHLDAVLRCWAYLAQQSVARWTPVR